MQPSQHFIRKYLLSSLAPSPGLGCLSPSKARAVGAETSCLTPGLTLSRANGHSNPSVESISIVGAGGKVFSSALKGRKDGIQTFRKRNTVVFMMCSKKNVYYNFTKHMKHITLQAKLTHTCTDSISSPSDTFCNLPQIREPGRIRSSLAVLYRV